MNEPKETHDDGKPPRGIQVRDAIRTEIAKAFVGKPQTTDLLLMALLAQGHVLVEGVPGIAKTTLVKAFAQTLGCQFARVQFTPDLLPGDITGTYILNMKDSSFELRKGPLFANVVLGDEPTGHQLRQRPAKAMQEASDD